MKNQEIIDFARDNYLKKCHVLFMSGDELTSKLNYCGGDETLTEVGFGLTEKRRFFASEIKAIKAQNRDKQI